MKHHAVLLSAALAIAAIGMVAADPKDYVNVTGDQLLQCNPGGLDLGFGQGGVCFEAGHITADGSGQATVTVTDDFLSPASMFICQDFDGNGICPDGPGEIEILACVSHTLTDGADWNSGVRLLIWVDGPVFGNPVLSPCGQLSVTVKGQVSHT
jgi:hypothetical protein